MSEFKYDYIELMSIETEEMNNYTCKKYSFFSSHKSVYSMYEVGILWSETR